MVTYESKSRRAWTVADAKARLSEVLRRAEEEGPQRIGTRRAFVVVPARVWEEATDPQPSLGQWLVASAHSAGALELPPGDAPLRLLASKDVHGRETDRASRGCVCGCHRNTDEDNGGVGNDWEIHRGYAEQEALK